MDLLKILLEKQGIDYKFIKKDSYEKMCFLLNDGIIYNPENKIESLFMKMYFEFIVGDNENVEKYFSMAINNGNTNSVLHSAILNETNGNDIIAIKYYTMATENDNVNAMIRLAMLNERNRNYDEAKLYYLMAIKSGNIDAMIYLSNYYNNIEKDSKNAKKYLLMAVNRGNITAFNNLIRYYKFCKHKVKLLKIYVKYPEYMDREKIINKIKKIWNSDLCVITDLKCLVEILLIYKFMADDDVPLSLKIYSIVLCQKIKIIRLHFKYTINGNGYEKAKEHFKKIEFLME